MFEKLKFYLTKETGFYSGLFSILAIVGWFYNGLYNTHFSISELMNIYAWIIGQIKVTHIVDSVYNSEKGVAPK